MRSAALSVILAAAAAGANASEEPKPTFKPTEISAPFIEQFTEDWAERWTPSEATKKTPVGGEIFSYVGQWKVEDPQTVLIEGDKGLVAKSKAAHHAISAPFSSAVDFSDKPLVVQYEVKYQKGGNCGGGYLKLLTDGFQTSGKEFSDTTPWVVMFGPDLTCPGNKVHFIFRHKNPITGEYEEKHLNPTPKPAFGKDTNLYTLVVNPDNTYEIRFNGLVQKVGNVLEDFEPPVNPPEFIDDPEDRKPEDWVDKKKIPDPDAVKPDDWDENEPYEIPDEDAVKPEGWLDDEPEMIPDPEAEKPEEWDDEEDGDWVAPLVHNPACDAAPGCGEWKRPYKANPKYKGKWYAPMIDNPEYKGEWKPRLSNPVKNLDKIGGVGVELWTMTEDILFNNIYVGHSIWVVTHQLEAAATAKALELDQDEQPSFKDDPVSFVRKQAQTQLVHSRHTLLPGAGLIGSFLALFGLLGALVGLIGSAQKPVPKDAPTPDDEKKDEKAPSKEETPAKRRK
ncbi:Calreticulin family-domain-containing protein [Pisolithus microcarpus]|nr:Calreticulin family-domain-containing protein [Pisolithus microcarpus]